MKYIKFILLLLCIIITSSCSVLYLNSEAEAACQRYGGNSYICDSADPDPTTAPNGSRRFNQDSPYGVWIKSSGVWNSVIPASGDTIGTLRVPRPLSTSAASFSLPADLGVVGSGSYTDTHETDKVYHQILEQNSGASAGKFEARYIFNDLVKDPVAITFDGRYQGLVAHDVFVSGRDFTSNIETGSTTTSATSTTITRTGALWVVDELIGSMIVMTSGPANTEVREVLSNTVDTITVAAFTISPTVGGGDTYNIGGLWTRLTADAQDISSSATDISKTFLIPGDRSRFKSVLNTFDFKIWHSSNPTSSHVLYVDGLMLLEEFISLSVSNTNYTIGGFSAGETTNTTTDGPNGTITVLGDGLFWIASFFSIGSDTAMDISGHIYINGTVVHELGFSRSMPGNFSVGSMSFSGVERLSADDVVEIKIRGSVAGILASEHGGFSVVRVSN